MKPFYYCVRNFFKGFFWILYRHKVYGLEHFIKGRAIIAANHASFLDPPLIGVSWPEEIAFLARKSLFEIPLLGWLISKMNAYPVSGTSRDLSSIKLICRLLEDDKKVVIFPEGVRTEDGEMMKVKSGIGMLAERCQSPIIPAYIVGSYDIWMRDRRFPKMTGRTVCVFGSPIPIEQFSHLEKKAAQEAIADKTMEAIANLKTWYDRGAKGIPP